MVLVLCMFVLCVAVRKACCGNLSPCIDGEWTKLRQRLVDNGCAEKFVEQNFPDFFQSDGDMSDLTVHLCRLFARLTAMLVSGDRLGDLCAEGTGDHDNSPLPCSKTTELEQLAAALRGSQDLVLSATTEVLLKLRDEVTCKLTCTPGVGAALCNGIVKSVRSLLSTTDRSAGTELHLHKNTALMPQTSSPLMRT